MPEERFDAIIIGTGFGATVVATELARMGKKNILMLERGLWWFTPERPMPTYITTKPGGQREPLQYWPRPDNRQGLLDMLAIVKTNNEAIETVRDFGGSRPHPLYRYNSFDDLDILTASGIGGGSLVYSNVSIAPFQDASNNYPVMEDWPMKLQPADYTNATAWMTANRGAAAQVVTKFPMPKQNANPNQHGYTDPLAMLNNNPNLYLGRSRFLKEASEQVTLGPEWKKVGGWGPLDLQIFEFTGDNVAPGDLKKFVYCERQGRCFMGCLPGARHTLNKTLISKVLDVPNAPVTLRALTEVDHIEQVAGGYRVVYNQLHLQDAGRDPKIVTAPVVVMAAGVLGTTQLLLKSQTDQFRFSGQLGRKFSSNGDSAGFVTGLTGLDYNVYDTRGPINTSHVMYQVSLQNGKVGFVNVEDAGIPPMLASSVKRALEVLGNAAQRDPFFGELEALWNLAQPDPSFFGLSPDARVPNRSETEAEMLMTTFFFNLMGRDEARGRFTLHGDDLKLNFEGGPLKNDPIFQKIDDVMKAMAFAMNGEYVRFPFWSRGAVPNLLGNDEIRQRKVVTVHPLGGCPMGAGADSGAVNTNGQVFNAAGGLYPGLFVADASVIPGPLAVNPTLSIVAMALKIAQSIAAAA